MPITYEQERTQREIEIDAAVLARVKKGLEWLEETHGPGWEDKIDLKTLDLSKGERCVLGQVYEIEADLFEHTDGYWYAREALMKGSDVVINETDPYGDIGAAHLGFNTYEEDDLYDPLQKAWEYVLEPRVGREA